MSQKTESNLILLKSNIPKTKVSKCFNVKGWMLAYYDNEKKAGDNVNMIR